MPPRVLLGSKEKKFHHDRRLVMNEYLKSQMIALKTESETDVELILPDGKIPCHSCILQAVSPFFDKIFLAQGDNKGVKRISIPDISVHTMMKVMQLVYDNEVIVQSMSEAEQVEAVVKYLEIYTRDKLSRGTTSSGQSGHNQIGFLITNLSGGMPDKIPPMSNITSTVEASKSVHLFNDRPHSSSSSTTTAKLSSGANSGRSRVLRPKTITPNKRKFTDDGQSNSDRADANVPSDDLQSSSSSEEESDYEPKSKKRPSQNGTSSRPKIKINSGTKSQMDDCLVAIQKLSGGDTNKRGGGSVSSKEGRSKSTTLSASSKSSSPCKPVMLKSGTTALSTGSKAQPTRTTAKIVLPKVINSTPKATTANSSVTASVHSESEGELSDDIESGDSDKRIERFQAEAKKCQQCSRVYPNPAEASKCLTEHKKVRCYFCFRVFDNTEKLFEHFGAKHRKAGRDKFLICPYCDTSVPFKSVSCHVISSHLTDKSKSVPSGTAPTTTGGTTANRSIIIGTGGRPGRPCYSSLNQDLAKKNKQDEKKDGELKVEPLTCTINHQSGRKNGREWVFKITKKR